MPIWSGFVSIIVAVVGCAVWITRRLERLEHRLENIELRIATVEGQNRALLKALPQVIASLITKHIMTIEQGTHLISEALEAVPIEQLLRDIKPTVNPLSQGDVDQLRSYVQRLKYGNPLSPLETRDFYRISDIVTREYPSNEGSWLLFLVGGILLGAMISDVNK